MFLLVPAYPGCPGSKAVKRSLLLLFIFGVLYVYYCGIATLSVGGHRSPSQGVISVSDVYDTLVSSLCTLLILLLLQCCLTFCVINYYIFLLSGIVHVFGQI